MRISEICQQLFFFITLYLNWTQRFLLSFSFDIENKILRYSNQLWPIPHQLIHLFRLSKNCLFLFHPPPTNTNIRHQHALHIIISAITRRRKIFLHLPIDLILMNSDNIKYEPIFKRKKYTLYSFFSV